MMRCHWGKRYSGSIDPLAQEGGSFKGALQWERPVGREAVFSVPVASGLVRSGQGDIGICKLQGYDLQCRWGGFLARLSHSG